MVYSQAFWFPLSLQYLFFAVEQQEQTSRSNESGTIAPEAVSVAL